VIDNLRGQMKRLLLAVMMAGVVAGGTAVAQPTKTVKTAAPAKEPVKKGKLVIAATTGLEDLATLTSSFKHAKNALESGYLEKVIWIGYGRSVVAFDPTVKAVPESVRQAAAEAKAAGVELVLCNTALQKFGIAPEAVEPKARIVPNGLTEVSRLIADGFEVLKY
jgi:intracellular sulfur oxidation DsrE/DsrF family protein